MSLHRPFPFLNVKWQAARCVRVVAVGLLFAGFLVGPAPAQQIDVIEPTGAWVTDHGAFLSDSEEQRLSERLARYASESSVQIVVVTLPSLGGVPASDYATELGRKWQVGSEGLDNGFVVLVSKEDRQVFIATGYGAEAAVPDAVAGRIVRNEIVPNFRAGRFYDGLSAAVDRLIEAASGEYPSQPVSSRRTGPNIGLIVFVILVAIVLIVVFIGVASMIDSDGDDDTDGDNDDGRRRRRRRRRARRSPVIIWGGGHGGVGSSRRRSGWSGGFSGSSGGSSFGGFSGGGGSFGGGGAGGSW